MYYSPSEFLALRAALIVSWETPYSSASLLRV